MRFLLVSLLLMSLSSPCWAGEDTKPNTLTPKEIAEGWILLFDGETNYGWAPANGVKVEKGALLLDGDKGGIPAPATEFVNFEWSIDYRVIKGNDRKHVILLFNKSGEAREEARLPIPDDRDWRTLYLVRDGKDFSASIRSKEKELEKWRIGHIPGKPLGMGWQVGKGVQVSLRNIKLKPLGMKRIFNGKDLSGWKEFPGRKSKFTVTKEGWLSITNGPGDLQTADQWADFVLQLDCRTNGDNLNSGVFFRCIPGEYQNGYEAQIQNQHATKPKMYTLEEYDPQTHKLVSKKKVENWSQDYGTGSIYRRVPARRAAAKDREWFTMTVLAHGRHFATWVNGIQVADWTDNRADNNNARNGCRLKKGPISLQGHDPTTDLYFRNIRLAELGGRN